MGSPILYYPFLITAFCLVPSAARNITESSRGNKDVPVGWQDNPSRRGTLAIIENCIFTILACTWSLQHLNIPNLDDKFWSKILRKCKWAVLTIFFPEFLMAHAIFEFVMAWKSMAFMKEILGVHVKYPWWRHYRKQVKPDDTFEWKLTHSYYANMGGFRLYTREDPPKTLTLTTFHLSKCWRSITKPQLSEEEIKDKIKANFFTKAVALVQISSLLLSILVRVRRGLAFSQLELITLAFAICGILTYVSRWYKPQDIEIATTVTTVTESGENVDLNAHGQRKTRARTRHAVAVEGPREVDHKPKPRKARTKQYIS